MKENPAVDEVFGSGGQKRAQTGEMGRLANVRWTTHMQKTGNPQGTGSSKALTIMEFSGFSTRIWPSNK